MKKLRGFISLSGILVLVLAATASWAQPSDDSSSKLIGKWDMIAGEEKGKIVKLNPPYKVIEFFSDKTLDFEGMNLTWIVLEEGRIKLTMSIMGAGAVFYASMQGDILKIPDPLFGGAFRHYRKKGDPQLFSASQQITDFYPIKEGLTWKYDESGKKVQDKELVEEWNNRVTVTNLSPRQLEGKMVIPRQYHSEPVFPKNSARKEGKALTFVAPDREGILFLGSQNENDSQPHFNAIPSYVIKSPLEPGARWKDDNQDNVITSVTESASLPQGEFHQCLKIKKVVVSPTTDNGKMHFEQETWYAPGVGLIKVINNRRFESPAGETTSVVEWTQILVSFQRP